MKKETTGKKVKRSAVEGLLWIGALVLVVGLVGAFGFVIAVLVSAPKATFVTDLPEPKEKKKKKAPATPPKKASPPKPAPKAEPRPGLMAHYFRFKNPLEDLPKLEGRKPQQSRVEKTINYESTDGGFAGTSFVENFAVRWEGLIRIPKDGKYTFFTVSDDGSWLYINGKLVVQNAGLHAMQEMRGQLDLKKGDHAIRVDFFEGSGGAGCQVLWEGSGVKRSIIPAHALFHHPKS